MKLIFGSIPLKYSFWDEFDFKELTICMRQKDDLDFFQMLNRIRIGSPTKNDIKLLESQVISKKNDNTVMNAVENFCELKEKFKNLISLFPNNDQADEFNKQISNKLNIIVMSILAEDFIPNSKRNNFQTSSRSSPKKFKISKTAGLASVLNVGIGSRIILRKNLDVNKGLVNGALGTIQDFNYLNDNKTIKSISIKFDKVQEIYNLERFSADYEYSKNFYVSRSQFPITLAWALTIHKTQGLSLEAVMIYLGKDIFEGGMAYVALSRATCLKNVFIIEFEPSILYANLKVIEEYNRLYEKFKMLNKQFVDYNCLPQNKKPNINPNKLKADLFTPLEMIENNQQIYNKKIKLDSQISNNNKQPTKIYDFKNNNIKKPPENSNSFINSQSIPTNYHLIFNNYRNGCFANVSIQALLTCPEFFIQVFRYLIFLNF